MLREAGVPVVEFRASIVIGAGSLSFEMIRALVERLPVMICPRWVDTRTQPIAIDDVLAYLRAALDLPDGRRRRIRNRRTRGGLLRRHDARVCEAPRPAAPAHTSTGTDAAAVRPVARPGDAGAGARRTRAGGRPAQSHRRALVRGARDIRDSSDDAARGFARAIDEGGAAQHKTDRRLAVVDAPPAQAFAPIRRIGGATGWYFGDALWRLRGWIDRASGGVGMPRSRRDPDDCVVGDVIDGWRVEAYEPDRLLRLSAGTEVAGPRLARVPCRPARRRRAIADPPDRDVRPAGRRGPALLVRRAAASRARVPRPAAADRAARCAGHRARRSVEVYDSSIASFRRWRASPAVGRPRRSQTTGNSAAVPFRRSGSLLWRLVRADRALSRPGSSQQLTPKQMRAMPLFGGTIHDRCRDEFPASRGARRCCVPTVMTCASTTLRVKVSHSLAVVVPAGAGSDRRISPGGFGDRAGTTGPPVSPTRAAADDGERSRGVSAAPPALRDERPGCRRRQRQPVMQLGR